MFDISEFRLKNPGLSKVMGALEAEVMEIIWLQGKASVRDVYEIILQDRKIAYTTVMTIMSRLEKKKILEKTNKGSSHIYHPVLEKDAFEQEAMDQIVDSLMDGFGSKVLTRLLGHCDKLELNDDTIGDLEKIIQNYKAKGQQ